MAEKSAPNISTDPIEEPIRTPAEALEENLALENALLALCLFPDQMHKAHVLEPDLDGT